MTISTTIIKNSFSGNGSTTAFNYGFKITAESEMQVIIRSSSGTETVKSLSTHYTISGVGAANGGAVTFTSGNIPVSGETVILRRVTAQTQAMDLIDNDPMSAETIETAHDKTTAIAQELQEQIDRSLKLSRTNTMTSTEFTVDATNRANKILAFDSAGEIAVTQELGTFKGNWAASTAYQVRDLVKDTSTNNIFIALTAHTSSGSQPLTTNTDSAKWSLIVDAASATTSQNAAASSATAAASSATAAAASAVDATNNGAAQVTLAAAQVALATTQANNSASSATNSSNSSTNSANSATASSNSATAAASSATAAAGSASAAAATFDNFDDSYLGAKSSNPSVDNDGDALTDGALYFDTTNDVMKVYDLASTTWLQLTPTVSNQNNINAVNSNSSNINTVAGLNSEITNLDGLSTEITNLNGIRTAISGVNTISAAVSAVNSNSSNINSVHNNSTNINLVAGDITNVNQLAGALSLETTFAVTVTNPGSGNVFVIDGTNNPTLTLDRGGTYIFDLSNGTNSGHPLAFKDGSGNSYTTGVTTTGTAGSSGAKVTIVVAANAPSSLRYYCTSHGNAMGNTISVVNNNLTTVAANITNVNNVAGQISPTNNISTLAGVSSNITDVANNITGVNSFAERYRVGSSDPTSSLDEGDLAYNSTGNVLKYYNGSAWVAITSGGITDVAQDGSPQLGGNLDLNGNDITGTGGIPSANLTGNIASARLTSIPAANLTGSIAEARLPAAALGAVWESKSANFTAEARKNYFVDTSSNTVDATLPSSASIGDEIHFLDVSGTFDTNNLTVARNSHKIQGLAQDMAVAVERAGFTLVYYNATQGWLLKDV